MILSFENITTYGPRFSLIKTPMGFYWSLSLPPGGPEFFIWHKSDPANLDCIRTGQRNSTTGYLAWREGAGLLVGKVLGRALPESYLDPEYRVFPKS